MSPKLRISHQIVSWHLGVYLGYLFFREGEGKTRAEGESGEGRRREEECEDRCRHVWECGHWVLCFRDFYLVSKGGDFRGGLWSMSTECSSVFQVCPFRELVSTDWLALEGIISYCSWSSSGFAAFLGLKLKYYWGLDVISAFTKTLWSADSTLFLPSLALFLPSLAWLSGLGVRWFSSRLGVCTRQLMSVFLAHVWFLSLSPFPSL